MENTNGLQAVPDVVPGTDDTWLNPDIVPFTKQDRQMLTEIHTLLTQASKAIEDFAPKVLPLLGSLGIQV